LLPPFVAGCSVRPRSFGRRGGAFVFIDVYRVRRRNIPAEGVTTAGISQTRTESGSVGADDRAMETKTMKVQACACVFLLSAALTVYAGERLTIVVSPLQSFAPTTLMVRIHVAPDVDNRALEITAESGDYFRSSLIPLDGKDAPRTLAVELRSLPGGDYQVRGTLIDNAGRPRASVRQQVIVLAAVGGGE